MNRHMGRGIDSDANSSPPDCDDRNHDIVANDNLFVTLAGQNQHMRSRRPHKKILHALLS